jgi:hypothetical protein
MDIIVGDKRRLVEDLRVNRKITKNVEDEIVIITALRHSQENAMKANQIAGSILQIELNQSILQLQDNLKNDTDENLNDIAYMEHLRKEHQKDEETEICLFMEEEEEEKEKEEEQVVVQETDNIRTHGKNSNHPPRDSRVHRRPSQQGPFYSQS